MPTGHGNHLLPALRRAVLGRESAERSDGQLLTAFVNHRDADAFAVLVRRHGPMVLGVCRRVIGNADAADDALQAVFLVLAKRAASVRPAGQVGNWLYGVAYRTAMKARAVLARRRCREKQVDAMPEPLAPPADPWSDLQPVIDEELARLPDRLRLPVVLCDLEGRPQRAVAKHLGIAPATLAGRLASARRLLAQRLTRRGISLSGGALAMLLGERASAAMIQPAVADGVVRAAEAVALGVNVSGLVSAHAIQLCEGVMRMMFLTKLKAASVCALAALVLTGGIGFGLAPAAAGDDTNTPSLRAAKPAQEGGKPAGTNDDAVFLRRVFLDLTGTVPTRLETLLFVADRDPKKRTKVVDWLLAADDVRATIARRLGIEAEQIRGVRVIDVGTGKPRVVIATAPRNPRSELTTNYDVAVRTLIARDNRDDQILPYMLDTVTGSVEVKEQYLDLAFRAVPSQPKSALIGLRLIEDKPAPEKPVFRDSFLWAVDPPASQPDLITRFRFLNLDDSDEAFLNRAIQSARGTPPSAVERKYFAEDKDPKKREKLLDLLLQDPAVAKKVGDDWKKKMLEPAPVAFDYAFPAQQSEKFYFFYGVDLPDTSSRFEKLIGDLLAGNKSDEQVLEAITLAAAGRLPSPEEKRATLAVIATAADKQAAWVKLAEALAGQGDKKSEPKEK